MRQTWHIFMKDARRLRFEIVVICALTAVYAWLQGHWSPLYNRQTKLLNGAVDTLRFFVLPMAWWYLVSRTVYAEPIPGDRQFWITRPYRRTSLLGAKLLFMMVFVSFPLMLADCFILTLKGLSPLESPAGLLWHALMVFATILLPMIALASITDSFATGTLVGLVIIALLLGLDSILRSSLGTYTEFRGKVDWIVASMAVLVVLSPVLAIMILQYRARRTWVSRVIFVSAAAVLALCGDRFPPGYTTWALQTRLLRPRIDTSSISAVVCPGSSPAPTVPRSRWITMPPDLARVTLPIRFYGLPSGTTAVGDVMLGELTPPNGRPLKTLLWFGASQDAMAWNDAFVERSLFEQIKGRPMRLHLNVYLTVLGDAHTVSVPLGGGPYRVPGVGMCEFFPGGFGDTFLSCWAPFRQPPYVLPQFDINPHGYRARREDTPFPAGGGINPIAESVWGVPKTATTLTMTTMQPLAHLRRELDIPNVRLADFAN